MLAGALALVACGGDDDGSGSNTESALVAGYDPTETQVATTTTTGESTVPAGEQTRPATSDGGDSGGDIKTYDAKPEMMIDASKQYFATIKMDIGDIRIELYPQDAPETVNSFVFLARDGFYDGVTFHRVIPGFVAQGGDPLGTGTGGPGYTIPDEVNGRKFVDGTVGMAKTTAPDSGGSQFYICYSPQPSLDGAYTVFGQIVEGRDVLDQITPREPSRATEPGTVINTIEIEEV
jgi:cyclophilin family peptidyl-prolyl cis-trans isomerase